MCRFLKDDEVKKLRTEEELKKAVMFYDKNDRWETVTASSIRAFGVTDYPLFNNEIRERYKETVPARAFDECVQDAGIFLTIPYEKRCYRTYATRYTAMESIYERSGSSCRMVRTLSSHGMVKALPAEERGSLIDRGWRTSSEEVKVLISDEKVSFVGSQKYIILPYKDGLRAMKDMLREYEAVTYRSGYISHEYIMAEWYLESADTESHRLMLQELGLITEKTAVRYVVRFSSSNIGNSKMSARLSVSLEGEMIPVGKPKSVWHLSSKGVNCTDQLNDGNGCSISDFRYKLKSLGASLKENEEIFEEMGNTWITYPETVLKKLFKLCPGIPKKIRDDILEHYRFRHPCTAVDLYFAVAKAQKKMDNRQMIIQVTEEIAQLQYVNYVRLDKQED